MNLIVCFNLKKMYISGLFVLTGAFCYTPFGIERCHG